MSDPADAALPATVGFLLSFVGTALLVFPAVWSVSTLIGGPATTVIGVGGVRGR